MGQKRNVQEAGLPSRPSWNISKYQKTSTGNVCPVEVAVNEVKNVENNNPIDKNNNNSGYVGLAEINSGRRRKPTRKHDRQVSLLPWDVHSESTPPLRRENIKHAVEELQAMWWTYTLPDRQNALVPDEPLETPWVQIEVLQSRPFLRCPEPYTFELPHYVHDPFSSRVFIGVRNAFSKKRVKEELSIDLPSEVVSRIKVKRLHRLVRTRNEIEYKNQLQDTYDIFLADYTAKEITYFNRFGKNFKFPYILSGDVGKDVATSFKKGLLQPNTGLKWTGRIARIGMKTENIIDNLESAIESITKYFPDLRQIWLSVQGLPKGCRLCVYCGPYSIYATKLNDSFIVPSGRTKSFPSVIRDYDYANTEKDVENLAKHLYD